LWANERAEFINKLKSRTLGATALIGTDHHLNIMVGDSGLSKLQEPTALFEFSLANPSDQEVASSATIYLILTCYLQDNKLCVEFSHSDLYSFFKQLERVQQQLDNLGGSAESSI
jgi:hypothetical protein